MESSWKKQNRLGRLLRPVARWKNHPGFDCNHSDVIDGGEDENEALLDEWPHGEFYGVPVWHMNESDERFIRLCNEYPRVAIGSCGDYDVTPQPCSRQNERPDSTRRLETSTASR
jgi:hypothetical protein